MSNDSAAVIDPSERRILEQWMGGLDIAQSANYRTATHYEKRQYQIGLPTVVLTTLVGTSVFTSLTNAGAGGVTGKLMAGAVATMSMLAAILSAVQTFFGYAVRAERHRSAAVQFGILKRKIERLLNFPVDRQELNRRVADLVDRWDALTKGSPAVPEKIWSETCAYYQGLRNGAASTRPAPAEAPREEPASVRRAAA